MQWIIDDLKGWLGELKYKIRNDEVMPGVTHRALIESWGKKDQILKIEERIKDLEKAISILEKNKNQFVETIAQKALRLLSEVPEEDFIMGRFTDEVSKCCAIGHFVRLTSPNPTNFSFLNCSDNYSCSDKILRTISESFLQRKNISDKNIATVNDSTEINGYTEPGIKDRVIHLLKDMIEAGY